MKEFYFLFIMIIASLLISTISFIMFLSTPINHKYAYIDLNGNLGLSSLCRNNYCDVGGQKIFVKEWVNCKKG